MGAERQGLIKKQALTSTDIAAIEQLARVCDAYDHATMRINWDMLASRPPDQTNDFLFYHKGALVGCLSLYGFGRSEAEASGMVHPEHRGQGIFRSLVVAAIEELRQRRIPKLLFFCDHDSASGIAFLKASGARYEHSEYRMDLEELRMPPAFDPRLQVDIAGQHDIDAVAHIIGSCFGVALEDMRQGIVKHIDSPAHRYCLGRLDATPIGALQLTATEKSVGIYGFGVLPEYRGRGYGRQILARAIEYATVEYGKPIFLEVVPENSSALGLYRSVGFKETSRYDYYALDI